MENYTPLIQRMLTALNQPLVNNSYVWSLSPGIPSDFKGSVLQYIIDNEELELINNNDWQTLANLLGMTETLNGSWLAAIVKKLEA